MTISDIYKTLDKNIGITIYVNDNYARYCETKFNIPIADMVDKITYIGMDEDGIVIHIEKTGVSYDSLNIRAKINAINTFINIISPYEDDYEHIGDMTVIDDMAYNFWTDSEYTIDVNGNWYDETGREITIETKDLIRR